MYTMTHTGASTRQTPDTKNISMLPLSSGTIQSRESNGVPQNSISASPTNVNALRDSRSVTVAASRASEICLTTSNAATMAATTIVSTWPLATPTASQNAAISSTSAPVRSVCLRASQLGPSYSHLSIRPIPINAIVTPIENGACCLDIRPTTDSATPAKNVSQPLDIALVEMRASDHRMSAAHTGGSILNMPKSRLPSSDLIRRCLRAVHARLKLMKGEAIALMSVRSLDSSDADSSTSGRSRIAATMFSLLALYEEKKTVTNVRTTPRQ